MARIAGVDLPKEKRVEIGLTYIYGIGVSSSNKILAKILPLSLFVFRVFTYYSYFTFSFNYFAFVAYWFY